MYGPCEREIQQATSLYELGGMVTEWPSVYNNAFEECGDLPNCSVDPISGLGP